MLPTHGFGKLKHLLDSLVSIASCKTRALFISAFSQILVIRIYFSQPITLFLAYFDENHLCENCPNQRECRICRVITIGGIN
jgi:hypothetical protein